MYFLKFSPKTWVYNVLPRVKSSANGFFIPENGIYEGIRRFNVKKIGKIAIFLRSGLKKTWFFAILGVFWGQKIFLTPESCFSANFTPRNDVFRKKFFDQKWPQKMAKLWFFWGTLYKTSNHKRLNLPVRVFTKIRMLLSRRRTRCKFDFFWMLCLERVRSILSLLLSWFFTHWIV